MKRSYRHMPRADRRADPRPVFRAGFKQAEIAELYGIRQHSVSRIVSGKVWA